MLRRLVRLSDKEIGRRCYIVTTDEMKKYLNQLNNYTNRQMSHYNTSDTISNSIYIQNYDIKNLKQDIIHLHARINDLTNIVESNNNNIEDRFLLFSFEVRKYNIFYFYTF